MFAGQLLYTVPSHACDDCDGLVVPMMHAYRFVDTRKQIPLALALVYAIDSMRTTTRTTNIHFVPLPVNVSSVIVRDAVHI